MDDPASGALTTAPASAPRAVQLPADARDLIDASISPNTHRAYRGALERWDAWRAERPEIDATVAEYVTALHVVGKAPATIGTAVAAVRFRARLAAAGDPVGPVTARILAGVRRAGRDRGRGQVAGVTWRDADLMAGVARRDGTLAGLRDATIVAVTSDALLRVSEVAAMEVRDLDFTPSDGSGTVTVQRSKTDQEGRGHVRYLGRPTVEALRTWMTAAQIAAGPVFRRIRSGGHVGAAPITARAVRTIIAARAAAAGVTDRVSGHSLRVGSAQSLAAAGCGLVELQEAGDWRSSAMPAHYARGQLAARGAVAKLRYGERLP